MRRYTLNSPFNIYHFEASHWEHPLHNHTYFEIIFILKGNGKHQINGNVVDYGEGDVFLLGPEDFHHFEIDKLTEFCFIRFNDYFRKRQTAEGDSSWGNTLKTLLHTASRSRGSIVGEHREKEKLHHLLHVLEQEYQSSESPYFETLRDSLMRSILTILARNLFVQSNKRS
ncbi:AraC family ligand binding domain-containing protein [Flagellimonas halotolerans]|uniref:AraC family ligand binding domain-containing protein n=1 Tax=Flagellimonas halotolerans TaxID=3112164 RepID=A0ABU6IRJ2_9FLAO|nr:MULTISPECIES: AraC family ligand binding domain-containing protein [unclassified Allomuricauda]MEC3965850.1 AraC family ligand binding domain-containing protein [Muricauda sp. SYSU M86414]MEC4265684.1 AraC family ligand binding domain-containing protein [Muricauda sp. SYSU M84420]